MLEPLALRCPECNSGFTKVVASHVMANGSRRRRVICRTCEHRWINYDGEKPSSDHQADGHSKSPLTDDDLRLILTSDLSSSVLAQIVNRSMHAVAAIRRGAMYRNRCPDLPRWNDRYNPNGLTCVSCYQWRGVCGLGIPESALEGVLFAQECAVFDDRTNPDV